MAKSFKVKISQAQISYSRNVCTDTLSKSCIKVIETVENVCALKSHSNPMGKLFLASFLVTFSLQLQGRV